MSPDTEQSILDERAQLGLLKMADRRHAEVEFPMQVSWLERAVVGNRADAPDALRRLGQNWFQRSHPAPRQLLDRMLFRARVLSDTKSEERLLKLGIDFPNTFNR